MASAPACTLAPMNWDLLYFRLSLVWMAITAAMLVYVLVA
ncbi:hypothetical protein ACVWY5_000557 [Bradyrhizobium sp. USDA 3256]